MNANMLSSGVSLGVWSPVERIKAPPSAPSSIACFAARETSFGGLRSGEVATVDQERTMDTDMVVKKGFLK